MQCRRQWRRRRREPGPSHASAHPPPTHTHALQVVRNSNQLKEFIKLEYLKEIGFCHMRIGDGVNSRLQLSGLLAKLCKTAVAGGLAKV